MIEKISIGDLTRLYKNMLGTSIAEEFVNYQKINYSGCKKCDLKFFSPRITGSESFYEKLQKFDWYYMDAKQEHLFSSQYIKETDQVLEVGSGKGAFSKVIKTNNYTGLEFSHKAQQMAANDDLHVFCETIECHAKKNVENYDVVCAFQVLEHVGDVKSFIESCMLALKPGGLLIFSVPNVDSFSKYVPNFILDMPPHHVTRWNDQSLRAVSEHFRLDIVDIWHEPLQKVHEKFYAQTVFSNAFNNIFKRDFKNIDNSYAQRFISLASGVLGYLFSKGLTDVALLPQGISATSVYRKKLGNK